MRSAMRIAVLGAGSWGTALAIVLAENGHEVFLWDRDPARARRRQEDREDATFLPGLNLPATFLVTGDLVASLRDATMVVFVVPSHTLRVSAAKAAESGAVVKDALIVSATKGLEEGTHERMSEILREQLGVDPGRIVSLVGPSHAEEVSRRIPTSLVAAGIAWVAISRPCSTVSEGSTRTARATTNTSIGNSERIA